MKRTKGITLIALIITIIVLLILAGVAIATLTGEGNIIGNAENAVGQYNNSVKGEQILLNTIEKYLENYVNGGEGVEEDRNNPIVTATEGEEIIEEGADNEISKYFTIDQNGTSTIKTVVYTDTSNGDVEVTNTNTLSIGTHIIKCTVTKETGATASATKTIEIIDKALDIIDKTEISNKPKTYFGRYVTNYLAPSGDQNVKWRIFYADESNIYLIADDYIHYNYTPITEKGYGLSNRVNGYQLSMKGLEKSGYEGTEDIKDSRITKWLSYLNTYQDSIEKNMRAVAFMLDINIWSAKYSNPTYADYAIGVPTLDLFCASYKKTHPDEYILYEAYNSNGYRVKWNTDSTYSDTISGTDDYNQLYYITDGTSKCSYQWIASPSAYSEEYLMTIYYEGGMGGYGCTCDNTGFRPIVCLKSGIQLEKNSDGTYLIKSN